MAQNPAASAAGVAIVYDTTLVGVSALLPSSFDDVRFAGDQRLEDEVLRGFDPAFHLSELSSSWVSLMEGASSFGEKL